MNAKTAPAPSSSLLARAQSIATAHRVDTRAATVRGVARACAKARAFRARPFPPRTAPRLTPVPGAHLGIKDSRRAVPVTSETRTLSPRARWLAARSTARRQARQDAQHRALGITPMGEAKALIAARDAGIARQVADVLAARWPHRRSESRWAGGDHSVSVSIVRGIRPHGSADRRPGASGTSRKVWSRNGKWTGSESSAELRITARAVAILGTDGLVQDGRIVLDATWDGSDLWCLVTRQGRGFDLGTEYGALIAGEFVAGATIEAARATYRRRAKSRLVGTLTRSIAA